MIYFEYFTMLKIAPIVCQNSVWIFQILYHYVSTHIHIHTLRQQILDIHAFLTQANKGRSRYASNLCIFVSPIWSWSSILNLQVCYTVISSYFPAWLISGN